MTDKANVTTVQGGKDQSYKTVIPKPIADASGIKKGTKLEWIMDKGDLVVRKVELSTNR